MASENKKQSRNNLPVVDFPGRVIKSSCNEVFDTIDEYQQDARKALADGVQPLKVLLQLLDDMDCAKFFCTAPVTFVNDTLMSEDVCAELNYDENVAADEDAEEDEDSATLFVLSGGKLHTARLVIEDEEDKA